MKTSILKSVVSFVKESPRKIFEFLFYLFCFSAIFLCVVRIGCGPLRAQTFENAQATSLKITFFKIEYGLALNEVTNSPSVIFVHWFNKQKNLKVKDIFFGKYSFSFSHLWHWSWFGLFKKIFEIWQWRNINMKLLIVCRMEVHFDSRQTNESTLATWLVTFGEFENVPTQNAHLSQNLTLHI